MQATKGTFFFDSLHASKAKRQIKVGFFGDK
jgi:hypothetical protein